MMMMMIVCCVCVFGCRAVPVCAAHLRRHSGKSNSAAQQHGHIRMQNHVRSRTVHSVVQNEHVGFK